MLRHPPENRYIEQVYFIIFAHIGLGLKPQNPQPINFLVSFQLELSWVIPCKNKEKKGQRQKVPFL